MKESRLLERLVEGQLKIYSYYLVNEFYNFYVNIGLFHYIFLCMGKDYTINSDSLIYFLRVYFMKLECSAIK